MIPETESPAKFRREFPVNHEIWVEEDEHGPLIKRSKLWSSGTSLSPEKYNPLDEPSPLGLNLRKSPSLLELIQMTVGKASGAAGSSVKKRSKSKATGSTEKLKASNFPATLLKIGQWEYKSRHEGDLVAKCYFAKQKLVWEVLEQGLKSKIEIQWSDIIGLKANFPEDAPGTLTLMLARRPLFFRETNPQPRRHTIWQAASDFTNGQANINRQHILQCNEGVMNKHFENLVQCDHRLFLLSRQPEIVMDTPFFDARRSFFGVEAAKSRNIADCDQTEVAGLNQSKSISDFLAFLTDSDSSQIKSPGLNQSMSMSDFVGLLSDSADETQPEHRETLESLKQKLLSDNIQFDTLDEKSIMPRVNSLFNLLYKDTLEPASSSKPQGILRKDSFSDLLFNLPRITSLPKFLTDISEEDGYAYLR